MLLFSSVLIIFSVCPARSLRFPITMPFISPSLPAGESYLCTGVAVDTEADLYITGFTPVASSSTVHHLMLIGCEAPVSGLRTNLWNCGGSLSEPGLESPGTTCPGSAASQVLYMWSLDAGPLIFPPSVSLTVGTNSSIRHLVLQVHYISKEAIPETGDTSGVVVEYQTEQTDLSAGIVSLHVHGSLPANSVSHWDSACRLLGTAPVQPWASLGHTHHHGRLVTGWTVSDNMDWTLLASTDPRQPQSFQPVRSGSTLYPGDILASRCLLQSHSEQVVVQGLASSMEMCDFFLYFWTRREDILNSPVGQQCTNKGPPEVSWTTMGLTNIPPESSTLSD